jgi:hypothetical protein
LTDLVRQLAENPLSYVVASLLLIRLGATTAIKVMEAVEKYRATFGRARRDDR